jgi:two-component system, NtrC family, sensor kinase
MARELRDSLEEKQRLIRAEAEASEREARRYNALLEDTVRTRTSELAEANVRLQDSLQQLQAAQEQLLFADRLASVGRLAAGVGHEINNPLAFILSNLRFVQQELRELPGAPSEEARQEMITALSEANEGAERVRLIVQDLRALARPDDVALGPVDLAEVVRGSAKMARHEVRDRARLVEACGGVPPVRANAARLGQVFLNLIINAAHAIEPGRVEENEIRVAARLTGPGHVTVEVRDTGAGISPENLRRIFDPFFTTKPAGIGTGLGLSVCHRIITALGGEIRVESEPGRGTCFFITLPVAERSDDSGPSSPGQSAA